MKSKKKFGFTLIELLAALVILAVILTIAVPAISGIVRSASKGAFEIDAKSVLKAIDAKRLEDRNFNPNSLDQDNISDLLGLSSDNYSIIEVGVDDNIPVIRIIGKGEWDGLIACGNYNSISVVESVTDCNSDFVSPVITVLGVTEVNIFIGGTYSDAGATALDNFDGDITSKIVTTGSVNPSVPGTYTITYSVSDFEGNAAVATRKINVIDNVGPIIAFNPGGNTTYAKTRSIVISVSDAGGLSAGSSKYTWTTSASQPTIDQLSTTFINNQTVASPLSVSGSYYLWAMSTDVTGNQTILGSNVFNLDNEKPVITISGNTIVTINKGGTYSDAGATATDNINPSITVTSSGTVNPSVVGTYTITYTATDSSGNAAISKIRTVNVIDALAPVITILGTNPISQNIGLVYSDAGATAIDDVDGDVTSEIVTTGTVNPNVAGTYMISYTVSDTAGNISVSSRTVNILDTVLPTVAFGTNGNTTYAKTRSTTVTVTDNASVNTSSLKYLWNTSTTAPAEASFTTAFTNGGTLSTPASVTGSYYLWILAKDAAGNTTIQRTNAFNLDNTKPVITITGSSSLTISQGSTYTDAGATAADGINGNITASIVKTGTVNPSIVGTYTITYNVSDSSGNAATAVNRTVTVSDTAIPTVAFGLAGNTTYAKTRSTTVTVSDNVSVNASSLKYLWNTSTTAPAEASFTTAFTNGGTLSTPAGVTGSYYLWILAKDTVGNTAIQRTNAFNLDNTKPILTLAGSGTVSISQGTAYSDAGATAADGINGNITASVVATGTVNPNVVGTYTITYNVSDSSGNAATAVSRVVRVTAPGFDGAEGVNRPVLAAGMTPIKWNGSAWVATTEADTAWYDYSSSSKQWANAQTADGSMWVWIPRYAYQIASGYHTSTVGVINVKFLQGTTYIAGDGSGVATTPTYSGSSQTNYLAHSAFNFGGIQLPGMWVGKFEAVEYLTDVIKIAPSYRAFNSIILGDMFTVTRAMEVSNRYGWGTTGSGIDTHLTKNIEWGAIAYLSQSIYGKNTTISPNQSYITGCASWNGTTCLYPYNTAEGQATSTTGNVYGIYDMVGGSYEYVAAYLNNGKNTGTSVALRNADVKYKDIYPVTTDTMEINYNNAASIYGDAMYETSSSYAGKTAWYAANSSMAYSTVPYFARGGWNGDPSGPGIFYFNQSDGWNSDTTSFRVVLLVSAGL